MHLTKRDQRWVVAAPAKINLTLEVLGRRIDGYHEIETLIAPVSLCDTLSVRSGGAGSSGQFSLTVHNAVDRRGLATDQDGDLPADDQNLALRAVRLLAQRAGVERGADIALVKRIPWQAGLGGGSSDAAAALLAANRAWQVDWPVERLANLGAELGSDVPAFFAGGACICRGRGELVQPVRAPAGCPLVVVKPPVGLATARVFSSWRDEPSQPQRARAAEAAAALAGGDWSRCRRWMTNALQSAALRVDESLARLARVFDQLPLLAHQLTGSGSAWFGLCRTMREARQIAHTLAGRGCGATYAVNTCL